MSSVQTLKSARSLKVAVPLGGATLATVLCFYAMYLLISVEIRPPDQESIRISAPLTVVERSPETRQARKEPRKVLPTEPPAGPDSLPQFEDVEVATSEFATLGSLANTIDQDVRNIEFSPPIKDLVAVRVVQPVYPFKAMLKEIEGHVLVQFTVKQDGTVLNPVVLESEPDDIFDAAALKAIQQFRFQPREAGGDRLVANNVRMRFAFRLQSPYVN